MAAIASGAGSARSDGDLERPLTPERIADAHADRVVLMPTAYTHPAGSVFFTSYDIVGVQAGFAASDSVQLTLTGTPPLGKDAIFPIDLTVKALVLNDPRIRIAALGSATGIAGFEDTSALVGRASAVAQLCFDDGCDASVSAGSTFVLAGSALVLGNGAGGIWPLSRLFALLFELDNLVPLGSEVGEFHGVSMAPGVRFRSKSWGVDLAIVRPLDVSGTPPVVPIVAATYRYVP